MDELTTRSYGHHEMEMRKFSFKRTARTHHRYAAVTSVPGLTARAPAISGCNRKISVGGYPYRYGTKCCSVVFKQLVIWPFVARLRSQRRTTCLQNSCSANGHPSSSALYIPVSYTHLTLPTNREV